MNGALIYVPDFTPVVEAIKIGFAVCVILALGYWLAVIRRRGF